MCGEQNGFIGLLQKQYPNTIYLHCSSHLFNLTIEYCCKLKNFEDIFVKLNDYAEITKRSPKRVEHYREIIKTLHTKYPKDVNLNQMPTLLLGTTRWSGKYNMLCIV